MAVVGGGPAGRRAAIAAAEEGRSVLLISRDRQPGRFASAMGEVLSSLPASIRLLAGWEAVALYRGGRLLLAAPHDGGPAAVIEAAEIVLATGRRSLPPLVPGADLPGVMDLPTAVGLLQDRAIPPGQRAFLIGTSALDAIAARLRGLGLALAGTADAGRVVRILGWDSVRGIELSDGKRIVCESVIHAGPWRPDPSLPFQAGSAGELRLAPGELPAHIRLAGSAALPPEPIACAKLDDRAFICPCMDVAVAEIRDLVGNGETHVEVLKRLTGCGMGPCQGMPCWDNLGAALEHLTGRAAASFGHPSYRAPRGGLTLGPGRRPRRSRRAGAAAMKASVAIIGGGVQGLMLAFCLAERGMKDVAVFDAGYWQGGASGRNGTMVRAGFSSPEWTRFFGHSHRLWLGLSRRLGHNVMYTQRGYAILAESDRTAAVIEESLRVQRDCGIASRPLASGGAGGAPARRRSQAGQIGDDLRRWRDRARIMPS